MTFKTRFAPSPTGPLHLGHAYSALLAFQAAQNHDGQFLLRIDDIDQTRSRQYWEKQIYQDLEWLGIIWDAPPIRQSDRLPRYENALEKLWKMGLLYPCSCRRKDIAAALSAPQEGAMPAYGPDGVIYPGTCCHVPDFTQPMPKAQALRLNISKAIGILPSSELAFPETGAQAGTHRYPTSDLTSKVGDIVLSRKDFLGSYHLAVVLDDADQEITHVIRGEDLFDATLIHVLLQTLLGLPVPVYHHHALIRDANGKRLAKRDDARAIAKYREDGFTPADVRSLLGL